MASHSSASVREHTPHENQTTRTATVIDALKRRAHAVLNDQSIDPQSRTIIRYGLETKDPWLPELVRRADAGERIVDADGSVVDSFDSSPTQETNEYDSRSGTSEGDKTAEPHEHNVRREHYSSREKIERLADIICGAGEESAGALLVLMGQMENAAHPQSIVHTVKHFAFTRCGELNVRGIVDTQIAMLEGELLGSSTQESAFPNQTQS